jgi:hypothetical protein
VTSTVPVRRSGSGLSAMTEEDRGIARHTRQSAAPGDRTV